MSDRLAPVADRLAPTGATISLEDRYDYCAARCTLDGKPATITGARLPYAVVRTADWVTAEFAWPTVARILERGGRFRT